MVQASFEATRFQWTGWDGSVWDLGTGAQGVTLRPGAEGFGLPVDPQVFVGESEGLHGGRFLGYRLGPREVFLPVKIVTRDGSRDFWRLHGEFLGSTSIEKPGVLSVTTELSERHVVARRSSASTAFDIDPGITGHQFYGLVLQSMSHAWTGESVSAGWLPPEPARKLWDAPGGVFFVMQGKDTSSATVTNPGSYASYPTWMIDGYTPAARVGVAGEFVDVPFPVPNGKCLVIETDPRRLSATMYDVPAEFRALPISERVVGVHLLNPVSRTRELGVVDFAPIPKGKDIPLSLSVSGTGLMQVKFPTLWETAF